MKKRILSLVLTLAMVLSMFAGLTISASAADSLFYTLTPAKGSNNSYAGNCDITIGSITWNLTGNSTMIPWRLGGKNLTNVDRTAYSKTAMGSAISKVELDVGSANLTVNSISMVVASDADFANVIDTIAGSNSTNTTITFTPTSGTAWATGAYYKFIFNVTAGGSNSYVQLSEARFYAAGGTTDPTDGPTHTHEYDWNGIVGVDGQHTLVCANSDDLCSETTKTEPCTYVNGVCSVCGAIEPEKPKYELVKNAATLHAGDHILIVGVESGTYYALAPYVSGNNNCRRNEVSAPVADVITTDVADITLGGAAGAWTLFDGTYYLYAAGGSSSNYLKGAATAGADTAKWTISCDANGVATIKCVANISKNWLRHNTSSDLFSCYGSGQADVSIYMKERPACEHLNKVPVTAKAPTCTEDGYTADGYYCPDCYTYIDTEVIEKLGHAWDEGTQTADPTCQTVGTMTFTCQRDGCDATRTEDVPTVGHDLQWNEAVGANGFHTLVCAFDCGYTEQAACTFDAATHLCTVCGAAAPACNITYSVPTNLEAPAAAEGVYNVILPALPEADGYTALGWSVTAIPAGGTDTAPEVMEAGAEYQPLSDVTLYAVYSQSEDTGNTDYLKVTKTADLTDGQYLIVYESGSVAMNGAVDAVGNGISVEIVNFAIASDATTDAAAFTFSASKGSFRDASGNYIGRTAESNGLNISDTTEYENAVSIDGSGNAVISASGCTMRYNYAKDQTRFRYYKSGQQAVQLYKKSDGIVKTYYTDFEASIHVCANSLTEHPAAAPGCETPGNSAYWECTCGKIYADAGAETLLDAIPAIAATGHTFVYTPIEDEHNHTVTCENCDYNEVAACVGELTEDGGTEMECLLCGNTWEVERFYLNSDVQDGDRIVIFSNGNLMSATATGAKLSAIPTTPDETSVIVPDGAAILTVADLNEGQFHLTMNGKYLTTVANGNSLTFADAVGSPDLSLWYIKGTHIVSVNALYNGDASKPQALEYYNGAFTTYSEKADNPAYAMVIYNSRQGCAHAETNLVGAVAVTCLLPGYTGDDVCTECGTVITPGTVIPALGHNFVEGVCTNADCGATQLTAVNVTSLKDGATIYFYNASTGLALSNAAIVDGAKTQFAGVPGTVTENTLTTSSDAILFTVEVVSGSGLAGQYKFKTADDLYLTYGDNRDTLTLAADSDHAIWAMDADYHISSVNSTYTYNNVPSPLYLEAYQGHFTCYNTSSLNAAFTIAFYDPSASDCNHQWDDGVEDPMHDCIHDGTITYTCSECGETKFDTVPADGVHHYDETTHICSGCGQSDPNFVDYSGTYYIAAIRSTGNYWWMTSADVNGKTRYDAVDSGLAELPAEIEENVERAKVWTLAKQQDGTYLLANVDGSFSTWSSGNTAGLGETGKALTVTKIGDIYNLTFDIVDAESGTVTETRYLSLNGTAGNDYFAYYKPTQAYNLSLVPVTGEIPATPTHTAVPTEAVDATCVAAGNVAYFTCQECAAAGEGEHYGKFYSDAALTEEIADVTLPIDSNNHVGYVAGETVPPTCTEQGYTVYTCSCGETENRDFVDALDHDYTYTNNGDDHTVGCTRCDYSVTEAHTFVEGTCVCGATEAPPAPTPDASLKFQVTAFNMGAELSYTFLISKTVALKYPTFYVEISKATYGADPEIVTVDFSEMIPNGNFYNVKFSGISAKQMGDTFTATIYGEDANGVKYVGESRTDSISIKLHDLLRRATSSDKVKKLAADMLIYGAAAQVYFDYDTENLVTADLTPEELACGTTGDPDVTNTMSATGSGIPVLIASTLLQSKLVLAVIFNAKDYSGDLNALTYKVIDAETDEVVASGTPEINGNQVTVRYDDIGAKRMRKDFKIGLYNGEELVSKVQTWSVESYVASQLSKAISENTRQLVITMINYGDSAAAYLG